MDSPSNDTPRQSLLAFLSRPSRPRTHAHAQAPTQPNSSEQPLPQPSQQQPQQHQQQQQQQQAASVNPSAVAPSQSQTLPPRRQATTPVLPSPSIQTGSLGNMLRRRRSANNMDRGDSQRRAPDNQSNNLNHTGGNTSVGGGGGGGGGGTGPTHRIRLVPHLDSLRSLNFEPISRDVRQGDSPLRIGRFTEHSNNTPHLSNKLAFKSKVVSRGHAEVWFENGSFYIKDTKSSSGTFLNHIRLSPPNAESRPFPIKDGDVLQLGVDYQGGTEEMYRCVKIRIELGREWQSGVNAFNLQALQQLKNLSNPAAAAAAAAASANGEGPSRANQAQGRTTTPHPPSAAGQQQPTQSKPTRSNSKAVRPKVPAKPSSTTLTSSPPNNNGISSSSAVSDCCICLSSVTILQALFIAPCSHAYHYKCIRPLLQMHHPGFSCPLCRTFADLEADVEGGDVMAVAMMGGGPGLGCGYGGGGGGAGQDDHMIVDGVVYVDEDDVILEEGDEEDGGGGNGRDAGEENASGSGSGSASASASASAEDHRQHNRGQPRRIVLAASPNTPEADEEGGDDAGAETDAGPESLGPAGMGGFRGLGSGFGSPPPPSPITTTATNAIAGVTASGGGGGGGGGQTPSQLRAQGFIHDPNVDVDPSVPGLRLPLREDEDLGAASSAAANMTLLCPMMSAGEAEMNEPSRFVSLIIEDGEEGRGGGGGGGVAQAGLVDTTLRR